MRKIKIGIDVGGTFTHAVAIDEAEGEIIGKFCLPTTHKAVDGVARGVVDVLKNLVERCKIKPEEILLIAHSTTQATNALLEGDVASVGIVGMGKGFESLRVKNETNIGDVPLDSGKFIKTFHRYIDTSKNFETEKIKNIISELQNDGAFVIVAAESFGVDDPKNEEFVCNIAIEMGIPAIMCSSVSQLYGLRVRTRTAVINASILPKMVDTANMTEKSIREAGITAPLMVMRSDGGIMDIDSMRKRPIMTILSGPAAGIAAALMYIKISDGIFIEVGGTSSDISAIKNGRPLIRTAVVGGHRLYLRTLDVRTVGIGGGSMVRINNKKIVDVGPRSAHIAGLKYLAFTAENQIKDPNIINIQPKKDDPDDYIGIRTEKNETPDYGVTPTEAANFLHLITEAGYGKGNINSISKVFDVISNFISETKERISEIILTIAGGKVSEVVKILIKEYKLNKNLITLVGGGGGAEAIVPFTAKMMDMNFRIAENTEIISAIGVALGIIRDTVERNIIDPTPEDILQIRKEASEKIQRMGALPETIEILIEIDKQSKKICAIATGSSELKGQSIKKYKLSNEELKEIVKKSISIKSVDLKGETNIFKIFTGKFIIRKFWGIFKKELNPIRVINEEGVIKLQLNDGLVLETNVHNLEKTLISAIDDLTIYGDAGAILPDVFLLCSGKIIDLTGLVNKDQMISVSKIETENFNKNEKVFILYSEKGF